MRAICNQNCIQQDHGVYNIVKVIIVLTVLLILLLSLNILVFKFQAEEAHFKDTGDYITHLDHYPVFCDELSLSPYEDYDTFNVKKNQFRYFLYKNRYVCSCTNLTKTVEKIVERKSRLRLSKGQVQQPYLQCGIESLRESSGYLSASFIKFASHQTFKGHGRNVKIRWDNHPENAFISKQLDFQNGELKVPEARFYFIYATVSMNISGTDSQNGQICRFYIRICAKRRGHERILLQRKAIYNTTDNNAVSTLNVGSHVFLARDETIFVRVSEASRLISKSATNVFGIIPLR
ncbi:uncharacterized protein LOC123554552 [Mercenaria mercenaria]|uniref:uncharacterized protein LOC123554552 n=1 Tax=Mercenaria mercenaria TaxID=6596 RepID=UPI001E1D79E0|nr:uncharacterized protein LOC123554552 [Mercenaria mercenaria]